MTDIDVLHEMWENRRNKNIDLFGVRISTHTPEVEPEWEDDMLILHPNWVQLYPQICTADDTDCRSHAAAVMEGEDPNDSYDGGGRCLAHLILELNFPHGQLLNVANALVRELAGVGE